MSSNIPKNAQNRFFQVLLKAMPIGAYILGLLLMTPFDESGLYLMLSIFTVLPFVIILVLVGIAIKDKERQKSYYIGLSIVVLAYIIMPILLGEAH